MEPVYYDIDSFNYKVLRKFCTEFKLGTYGTKKDLADRAWDYVNYNKFSNIVFYRIVDNYIMTT